MLLSALCCNCRVHCDLRHGPCKLLCLGGLQNPHRANLTLVGVVLSDELSFHFYFSIFVALMVGIGKLRIASWIIKQRMNKKNIQGWFYLFCYLKNIWSLGWFFRGLNLSAKEWKTVSSALTHISGFTKCVLPHFIVVWGRKKSLEFHVWPSLCISHISQTPGESWPVSRWKGSLCSAPSAGRRMCCTFQSVCLRTGSLADYKWKWEDISVGVFFWREQILRQPARVTPSCFCETKTETHFFSPDNVIGLGKCFTLSWGALLDSYCKQWRQEFAFSIQPFYSQPCKFSHA